MLKIAIVVLGAVAGIIGSGFILDRAPRLALVSGIAGGFLLRDALVLIERAAYEYGRRKGMR